MACILIIDDEVQIRKMLRQQLERAGYDVIESENGEEGLKHFRQNKVDLVITDLIMPEKEGLETISELTNEYPGTKIIAISGGGRISSTQYLKLAKKLGALKTFDKPIERDKLLAAVQEILEK